MEPDVHPDPDGFDDGPRSIAVMMLLADGAQVADRKLFILGGGLTTIGPRPQPIALAIRLLIPWNRANISHEWLIELLDEDGQPIMAGDKPLQIRGNVTAGRPAGVRPGTPLPVPVAINLGSVKLTAAKRFAFQLSIDGETRPDWRVVFDTRPEPATAETPPAQT